MRSAPGPNLSLEVELTQLFRFVKASEYVETTRSVSKSLMVMVTDSKTSPPVLTNRISTHQLLLHVSSRS